LLLARLDGCGSRTKEQETTMRAITPNRWLWTGALTLLAASASVVWWTRARAAAIPATNALHYAGTLSEKGVPVDGPRDITIVLWSDSVSDAAEDRLCVTQSGSTPVAAGRFEVLLDDSCTTAVGSQRESWAEVQVGGISFGRQKIGAVPYSVISSKVDGIVLSDAVLPNYANDGSQGRGAGEASIYNDGGSLKELTITGNNSGAAGHKIGLLDDVRVGRDLTVNGQATVKGNLAINGKAGIGVYVNETHTANVYDQMCNFNAATGLYDRAISGGGICGPGDTMIMESRPVFTTSTNNGHNSGGSAPVGWHIVCINHDFAFQNNPAHIYAVCLSHGQ
jgi:hypothetical protein